ncbi:hypothetical protein HKX48_008392 [Thoreauomyces humboldtii]|nr:hypothetical protein HKX48_008392 [Thoreauomyces humboldtii]
MTSDTIQDTPAGCPMSGVQTNDDGAAKCPFASSSPDNKTSATEKTSLMETKTVTMDTPRKTSAGVLGLTAVATPFIPRYIAGVCFLLGALLPWWLSAPILLYITLPPTYELLLARYRVNRPRLPDPRIIRGRVTGKLSGDHVVFLIGARLNNYSALMSGEMADAGAGMQRMQAELLAHPELGCLHTENYVSADSSGTHTLLVQYWRSVKHLQAYSRSRLNQHFEPMVTSRKRTKATGDVGIWHETFLVQDGNYEAIYVNMPQFGLGAAGHVEQASVKTGTMKDRLHASKTAQTLEDYEIDPSAL